MMRSIDFMGIKVDDVTPAQVLEEVDKALSAGCKYTISQLSPNTFNLIKRNAELRCHLNSMSVVCPDSAGVTLGAKILGQPLCARVPGDVLAPDLYRMAIERGIPVYLLGGEPGVARRAADVLLRVYPGLDVCGVSHGFLSAADNERVIQEICQQNAGIVLVGMGVPHQEKWIFENAHRVSASVLIGVGGYFDHIIRRIDCYPAWVFKLRLVWVYRLLRDPKRLWKRYLVGNPLFLWSVFRFRLSAALPFHSRRTHA